MSIFGPRRWKQQSTSPKPLGRVLPPVYHWRSGERDEVDFVVELTSDMTIPIECKLTGQPSAADAQGIQRFLQIHGVKGPGVVISAQEDCFWLTPNVLHIPLSAL
jgi:predicted AAA+ superfamily ATPase